MTTSYHFFLYLRSQISHYVQGGTGSLADIARLEEGFYHDLKGLYSKRLGLPINKYKSGDRSPAIAEDIKSGANEVIKLFSAARFDLFRLFQPDWSLVRIFNLFVKLDKAVRNDDLDLTILLLEEVKQKSDSFHELRVKASRFEIDELLSNLVSDFRTRCRISFTSTGSHHRLKLPYSEYNNWKRILRNFMVNATEACEEKREDGSVEVKLANPETGHFRIEIIDNGIGMDQDTLANFTRRGFTRGKLSGQGLGVNEDAIAFLERHGRFEAVSSPGKGTCISIDMDIGRIAGASSGNYPSSPRLARIPKTAMAGGLVLIAAYLSLSAAFDGLRFWEPPNIEYLNILDGDPGNRLIFHEIAAFDGERKELFRVDVDSPLCVSLSQNDLIGKPITADANGNNRADLIFATSVAPHSSEIVIREIPYAACYDGRKNLLWKTPLGPEPPRPVFDIALGMEGSYSSQFYGDIAADSDGSMLIPIIACADGYPTQMSLLNKLGNKRAEYWHTGDLMLLTPIRDYDNDSQPEYVLYGMNNCIGWSPAISILELGDIFGQSAPYLDSIWSRAREEKYYLFGHAWIDESPDNNPQGPFYGGGKRMSRIMFTSSKPVSYVSWDSHGPKPFNGIEFSTDDGRSIILDDHANLDTVIIDTSLFSAWWYSRQAQIGKSDMWTESDLEQLRGYRKYENGRLTADSIFHNANCYNWDYWKDQ